MAVHLQAVGEQILLDDFLDEIEGNFCALPIIIDDGFDWLAQAVRTLPRIEISFW